MTWTAACACSSTRRHAEPSRGGNTARYGRGDARHGVEGPTKAPDVIAVGWPPHGLEPSRPWVDPPCARHDRGLVGGLWPARVSTTRLKTGQRAASCILQLLGSLIAAPHPLLRLAPRRRQPSSLSHPRAAVAGCGLPPVLQAGNAHAPPPGCHPPQPGPPRPRPPAGSMDCAGWPLGLGQVLPGDGPPRQRGQAPVVVEPLGPRPHLPLPHHLPEAAPPGPARRGRGGSAEPAGLSAPPWGPPADPRLLRLLYARAGTPPASAPHVALTGPRFSFNDLPVAPHRRARGSDSPTRSTPSCWWPTPPAPSAMARSVPTLKNGYTVYSQVTVEVMDATVVRLHHRHPLGQLSPDQRHMVLWSRPHRGALRQPDLASRMGSRPPRDRVLQGLGARDHRDPPPRPQPQHPAPCARCPARPAMARGSASSVDHRRRRTLPELLATRLDALPSALTACPSTRSARGARPASTPGRHPGRLRPGPPHPR